MAVVERFKQESMYGLSAGTKKRGRQWTFECISYDIVLCHFISYQISMVTDVLLMKYIYENPYVNTKLKLKQIQQHEYLLFVENVGTKAKSLFTF